jgi:hypothetical protein
MTPVSTSQITQGHPEAPGRLLLRPAALVAAMLEPCNGAACHWASTQAAASLSLVLTG